MNKIKPYRLKHIPTGLYYRPWNGISNISENGKVYFNSNNGLKLPEGVNSVYRYYIRIKDGNLFRKYSKLFNMMFEEGYNHKEYKLQTNIKDWRIEDL